MTLKNLQKQYDMNTENKKKNWTKPVVGTAILLALGFFFLIDADAARHSTATGKLWSGLAIACFVLVVLAWVAATVILRRK